MVLAMLILLSMADRNEMRVLGGYLSGAVGEMWGWDDTRLKAELENCRMAMVSADSRLTCWFTVHGMEFDINVPQ